MGCLGDHLFKKKIVHFLICRPISLKNVLLRKKGTHKTSRNPITLTVKSMELLHFTDECFQNTPKQ